MAKAASPIRLQNELMQAAETTARRFHRSTAEQIEYWAELGRSVSSTLDPDVLLSIVTGLARLNVEPVTGAPLDTDEVFNALEAQRDSGALLRSVTGSAVRYQTSLYHPGLLERIDQNGTVTTGQFENGEFIAQGESAT
jgi:hypothetical protein